MWTVRIRLALRWACGTVVAALAASIWGCTTIDPGPQFRIPLSVFNENFFYCHVEPEYLFNAQTQCGSGASGDNGNCHFNSSAVSGMALLNHTPIDCGGGDAPLDKSTVGQGSPARANFTSASLEMSRSCADYQSCQAAILKRPTTTNGHPRQIFDPATNTALAQVIFDWAAKP